MEKYTFCGLCCKCFYLFSIQNLYNNSHKFLHFCLDGIESDKQKNVIIIPGKRPVQAYKIV